MLYFKPFPPVLLLLIFTQPVIQGCTVLAIADTVGSVAVGAVGLAADTAIGTAKLTGKAVGAVAGAVIPDGDIKK
jgi:hypothetical protein